MLHNNAKQIVSNEVRNMIAFWIFGLCNSFVFTVMLSAAQDILGKNRRTTHSIENVTDTCVPQITSRICTPTSAGVVLLCMTVPALVVKLVCPFFSHRLPYGIRHFVICTLQMISLLVTAFAESSLPALIGVCIVSLAGGLGEVTYLGLAGHYSKNTIVTWSSGTGVSGLVAAFSYAGLTDARLLALTSTQALLVMLIIPVIFAFAYYVVLVGAPTVRKVSPLRPSEWFANSQSETNESASVNNNSNWKASAPTGLLERLKIIKGLLRYMVPLILVYFAEYVINQGVVELITFDCEHGYGTSPRSQYKWYQVTYQIGVFISRSSLKLLQLNMTLIALLPLLQFLNMFFLMFDAIYAFLPHFGIVCAIILYEGLIGGASYVNTFHHIHRKVHPSIREFALSTVILGDTIGVIGAGISAIPIHNAICKIPWYS